jgi:ribose transport system substrate-binding protein
LYAVRRHLVRVVAGVFLLAGCTSGGSGSSQPGNGASCPEVFAAAKTAVAAAQDAGQPWTGPTTGPRATSGKTVVYVAQSMTNPGVAGVAKGAAEAADVMGWYLQLIDGQGTQNGIKVAFSQAVAAKPDGIIIGGFDPDSAARQVQQANAAGIPLVGWHAVGAPGPSESPKLFTNVTTKVEDVAVISAQWIIQHSGGTAGVVVFTDTTIPYAKNKSQLIEAALKRCAGVNVLATVDIPIVDASIRTPPQVSSLIDRLGDSWTHSVAINDLYFADAAPALRQAGKDGAGPPFNIGAGDGDPVAYQRIRDRQYQTATVPEPLLEQGWQVIDELNRAIARQPSSGYVAPVHLTTTANVGNATYWEPGNGYREQYTRIWGR